MAKELINPILVDAYIYGGRLTIIVSPFTQALMQATPALTIPYFNQQRN